MKKFIAVFDGYRFSKSTLQYSIQVSQLAGAHLVGVFLDEFVYRSYDLQKVIMSATDATTELKRLDEADKGKRDEAVKQFREACEKAGITFSVHRDKSVALQELKHESMFADLVIMDATESFNTKKEKPPTAFMRDLLGDVQCPVMVVPKVFKPIDKIVLLYDGRPSSLYAIKMFSYLFSNLLKAPVEVLSVKEEVTGNHVPDNKLMKEFIKRHFPNVQYVVLKGQAEGSIPAYLRHHKQNELVVLGAYRRSEISRWFKTSMADVLMKELDTPLFIAHN